MMGDWGHWIKSLGCDSSCLDLALQRFWCFVYDAVAIFGWGLGLSSISFQSKFLRHKAQGKSPYRIGKLWTSSCPCGKNCFRDLQRFQTDFHEFINLFWGLSKLQQDVYVSFLIWPYESINVICELYVCFLQLIPIRGTQIFPSMLSCMIKSELLRLHKGERGNCWGCLWASVVWRGLLRFTSEGFLLLGGSIGDSNARAQLLGRILVLICRMQSL